LLSPAGMNALLMALLLTASPEVPPTSTPAEPRYALWMQPVGTALFGLYGQAFYLPLGMNVPLSGKTSLALELTPVLGTWRSEYDDAPNDTGRHWRVAAAAGPLFSFGDGPLSGPFIEPKLMTVLAHDSDYGYDGSSIKGGTSFELQAGLDVGWQFSAGGWYFTPMLGASAGYCFNCSGSARDWESSLVTPMARSYSMERHGRAVFNVNLNLLRLGTVF